MKKLLFCFSISLLSFQSPAQDSLSKLHFDSISKTLSQMDSIMKKKQEENLKTDQEPTNSNLNSLVKEIQSRDKKEKQQMYLRIALGILFFILLVIGLFRRSRKKKVI